MLKNYIIGNGLAGLLACYYLKDYYLIGQKENTGGQFNSTIQLGPRYILNDSNFRKLLKSLKIKFKIKTIRIGYYYGGLIFDELDNNMQQQYLEKTRGTSNTNIKKSAINSSKNTMEILEFNMQELIKKLTIKCKSKIIDYNVFFIKPETCTLLLTNDKIIHYKKLISTLNADTFFSLCGYNEPLKDFFRPIYFYKLKELDFDMEIYDFIYVIEQDFICNRITKVSDGFIIESPEEIEFDSAVDVEFQYLKKGKIVDNIKMPKFKNIQFLGRYAEMKNELRINDVLNKIVKIKNGKD